MRFVFLSSEKLEPVNRSETAIYSVMFVTVLTLNAFPVN